ncbi:hypothetical protein C6366_12840 [Desulfonatronum sp. SC1]|nr:hypothetical protein C6366_12840 [Desulfonatronum sp. SC1]
MRSADMASGLGVFPELRTGFPLGIAAVVLVKQRMTQGRAGHCGEAQLPEDKEPRCSGQWYAPGDGLGALQQGRP